MIAPARSTLFMLLIGAALSGIVGADQGQARDPNAAVSAATPGVVSGVVMSDETTPRPLRHARVSLTGGPGPDVRPVLTDDEGRFSLNVPVAGRYTLVTTKSGYIRQTFGAARVDRRGTAITVTAGQRLSGLTVRLARGSVIAGSLTDETGQPASGVTVRVMQFRQSGDDRVLNVPPDAGLTEDRTDDRGAYRLYGLPAGDYRVEVVAYTLEPEIVALSEPQVVANISLTP